MPDELHSPATHRGPSIQHLPECEEDDRPDEPGRAPIEAELDFAGVSTGQNHVMPRGEFVSNVAPRMGRADDQHRSRLELFRILVLGGMQLHDARVEFVRERRDVGRPAERTGRDDHVVRLEVAVLVFDPISILVGG
jgi:hypothetical protein